MTLKGRIEKDYLAAFKEKNVAAKTALSMLKTSITKAEKENRNQPISEDAILKLITKAISERKDSIKIYKDANVPSMIESETAEMKVLEVYLPEQLSPEQIKEIAVKYMITSNILGQEKKRRNGQTMGYINKTYAGQVDKDTLQTIINEIE